MEKSGDRCFGSVGGFRAGYIPGQTAKIDLQKSGVTQTVIHTLDRIAGEDRYETSYKIARRFNDGKVDHVIVAGGSHFADALSAAALARKLNAPILLADSGHTDMAEEYIKNHLSENGKVYLIGDTPNAYPYVTNIERIGGADYYQTNIAVLNALDLQEGISLVIASGESFPDALTVAGFGLPVILTDGKALSAAAKEIIKRVKPEKVYIAGGYGVVSLDVERQVGMPVKRLAGSNRFATAAAILREFLPKPTTLYIMTGYHYADALAGSVLGPIMIIDPNLMELPVPLNDYLVDAGTNVEIIPLGGPSAIRNKTLEGIKTLYPKQEFKKTDFVNLADYAPNILLDIRYATTNNFTGTKLYDRPNAYLRKGTADKLKAVAEELAQEGYHLCVWDAYRPVEVQWKLWNVFPNANYIANPNTEYSNHNRGSAVDVTIHELEMPTDYDDFTWKARREYQNDNAKYLERIMVKHGFKPYAGEWWHFDDTDYYEPVESLVLPPQRQPKPLPKTSITISAIGDNVIGQDYFGDFDSYYAKYGADYFFANVKHIFHSDDLTIANLETTLTDATVKVDKSFQGDKAFYFKGRPEYTKILISAGIDTVNIANNHTFDFLQKGYEDTINNLAKAGIGWFGYTDVDIQEVKGKRIALLGYNLLGPIEEGINVESHEKTGGF